MKYDGIIFDIDGTLWNASPSSAKGWTQGLKKLGIEKTVTADQIESVAGNSYKKCIDILLPGMAEQFPALYETLNTTETEIISREGGVFYPGVLEGIRTLSGSARVFLVSNCQDWYMKQFLTVSGLEPFLSGHDCHGSSGMTKDTMLSRMQAQYSLTHPVYVGDTAGDETAAKNAGMEFIHAAWGFGMTTGEAPAFDAFPALMHSLTEECIRQIHLENEADTVAALIRSAFATVAHEFGLTPDNAPTHPSFTDAQQTLEAAKEKKQYYSGYYENGVLSGCYNLEKAPDTDTWYLGRLAVLPEKRHRGIGKKLLIDSNSRVRRLGGKKIQIAIINENTVLKKWYTESGFTETGTRTFPHLPFTVCFMEYILTGEK